MSGKVIIACDFATKGETLEFLGRFGELKPFVKIGMELFYGEGPDIVRRLKGEGYSVFLDLKLHDIPNTVNKAMRNLARLGVDMTNVHAAGGSEMMRVAREGLQEGAAGAAPMLIAVTQLTSTSQERLSAELLIDRPIGSVVAHYALNARESGLDGVVCSPLETALVRSACGPDFLTVTPGIRYAAGGDDQSRVTTPAQARDNGSSYIVVGRPITAHDDPVGQYRRIVSDFEVGTAL